MREAAAAIALDPALSGAAELVGRLMLEPPKDTPAEVKEAMAVDDVRDAKEVAKAGIVAIVGALFFTPLLWYISPPSSPAVAVFVTMLLLDAMVAYHVLRAKKPRTGMLVLANTVIVVMLARMFSPILIAPGVAASLAMAMVLTPKFSWLGSPVTITALMTGAVGVPLLLEQVGALAPTMSVSLQGVLFDAPAISGEHPAATVLVGALYAIGLVFGAALAGYHMRRRALQTTHRLHMQSWQLRQLVPR